ncbi:LIC_13355 family lipoprotein [Haliangium sp.]
MYMYQNLRRCSLWVAASVSMSVGGCGGGDAPAGPDAGAPAEGPAYADVVVNAPGAGERDFGDPGLAVNGVRGGGVEQGSVDVYSLGTSTGEDGPADHTLTLAWSGRVVINEPGIDFVVFENPFATELDVHHFIEAAVVEVSRDGQSWVAMPHDYTADDETVYVDDPTRWQGFAGVHPVLLHEEDNPVDPMDPALAGGDGFDLADLPDDGGEAEAIKREGFSYLRIVTATTRQNPDTGAPFPTSVIAGGPDIDGVYARSFRPLDNETP